VNESYLLHTERCPQCARVGHDRSGNNLAVYSDGHSYCYCCGWLSGSDILSSYLHKNDVKQRQHEVYLPSDCDTTYPAKAIQWMGQYELDKYTMLSHNLLWSEQQQRLIFPVYDSKGLQMWCGRYFGQAKEPKWKIIGDKSKVDYILGVGDKLVIVEDVVSAIKLSKYYRAMPIFGSFIGNIRFKRLKTMLESTDKVFIWLDPDKRKEAIIEQRRASLLGLDCHVIISEKDPKEEDYEKFRRILNEV